MNGTVDRLGVLLLNVVPMRLVWLMLCIKYDPFASQRHKLAFVFQPSFTVITSYLFTIADHFLVFDVIVSFIFFLPKKKKKKKKSLVFYFYFSFFVFVFFSRRFPFP